MLAEMAIGDTLTLQEGVSPPDDQAKQCQKFHADMPEALCSRNAQALAGWTDILLSNLGSELARSACRLDDLPRPGQHSWTLLACEVTLPDMLQDKTSWTTAAFSCWR